jgi:hypothetical protein
LLVISLADARPAGRPDLDDDVESFPEHASPGQDEG